MSFPAVKYTFMAFGIDENGKAYAKARLDDGSIVHASLNPPTGELECTFKYRVVTGIMVAMRGQDVCDAPIILDHFTRGGIILAIKWGLHPEYRPWAQWEFDRWYAIQREPGYNWNAEVYHAVAALSTVVVIK